MLQGWPKEGILACCTLGPLAPLLMSCVELGCENIYLAEAVMRSPVCLFMKSSAELGLVVHTCSPRPPGAKAEGS